MSDFSLEGTMEELVRRKDKPEREVKAYEAKIKELDIKKTNIGNDIKVVREDGLLIVEQEQFQELIDQINKKFNKIYSGLVNTGKHVELIRKKEVNISKNFKELIKELSEAPLFYNI